MEQLGKKYKLYKTGLYTKEYMREGRYDNHYREKNLQRETLRVVVTFGRLKLVDAIYLNRLLHIAKRVKWGYKTGDLDYIDIYIYIYIYIYIIRIEYGIQILWAGTRIKQEPRFWPDYIQNKDYAGRYSNYFLGP